MRTFAFTGGLLATLYGCSPCGHWDIVATHYSSSKEVHGASKSSQGWLPPYLPSSASDIYEKHDLDTNRTWVRYAASPKDIQLLSERLTEGGADMEKILTNNIHCFPGPKTSSRSPLQFYHGDGGYYFIDTEHGQVFFYRERY